MVNINRYIIPDSLVESGGTITATLKSKSYQVVPNYSGLIRNTRYQLYMAPGGTIEVSSLELSQAPIDKILIGSFYTNGLDIIGFGSFVNIIGVPITGFWDAGKTIVYNTSESEDGAVSTNPVTDSWKVQRIGKNLFYLFDYFATSSTGTQAGASSAYIFWPRNFSFRMDNNFSAFSSSFGRAMTAYAFLSEDNVDYGNTVYAWYIRPYGVSLVESGQVLDSGKFPLTNFTTDYSIKVKDTVPIDGWNETPIKDL